MITSVYAPCSWTAEEWGIDQTSDNPDSAIISVPVFFNQPHTFCYRPEFLKIDLSNYELVILSDIEYESIANIQQWIAQNKIKRYILSIGGLTDLDNFDSSIMVYRPWWCYNLLNHNLWQDTHLPEKKYLFDALLGARRPHRDYAMLALDKHNLLAKSIVTYRSAFSTGHVIDHQTHKFASIFPDHRLKYPYVSENLMTEWEVQEKIEKSISYLMPWQIYQHTWFSVVTETLGTGNSFFLSEKTAKVLYAERVFVMFSNAFFLKKLHDLGFETFGDIVDESYDNNVLDFERFKQATDQLIYLGQQDPVKIYQKVLPRLKHNHQQLFELQIQTKNQQKLLLQNAMPDYVIN
jgi:hypothetical protein